MGFQMASNIRKRIPSQSTLFIYDVFSSACTKFAEEYQHIGPIVAVNSAKEAAEKADVVISMVPGPADVRKVYLDETNGIVAAEKREGRLLLECSTIDSATTRAVGGEVMGKGRGVYVDCPVSVCWFRFFWLGRSGEVNIDGKKLTAVGWCDRGAECEVEFHDWVSEGESGGG